MDTTATGALHFPFAAPPGEGATAEIAPGLLWLRMPLPFALDHVNLWLLEDGDGWAAVDCGVEGRRTRAAWDAVLAGDGGGRPLTRVLATHFHPDHLGLADWLCRRDGAALWMSQAEWLLARMLFQDGTPEMAEAGARFYRACGLPPDALAAMAQRGNAYSRGVPAVPAVYTRMRHGDTVRIGGIDWTVLTGGGHSPEHVCLHDAARGILIAGDQVLPSISPNVSVWPSEPDADPLAEFLECLERLRALPADTLVLPSHGLPFRGLHARLDALAGHHAERLEETLAACAQAPASVMDLTRVLFRRALDTHQMGFAVGEALAHLNHLWRRGRLRRAAGTDGVLRFAAA